MMVPKSQRNKSKMFKIQTKIYIDVSFTHRDDKRGKILENNIISFKFRNFKKNCSKFTFKAKLIKSNIRHFHSKKININKHNVYSFS